VDTQKLHTHTNEVPLLSTLFRRFFEISGEGAALLDNTGIVVDVNNTLLQITGLSQDVLIGRHVTDIAAEYVTDEYAQALERVLRQVLDGEHPEAVEFLFRDKILNIHFAVDTGVGIIAFIRDVTSHRDAVRTHTELEHLSRSILETSPDIIYRLDRYGNIMYISSAVRRYGYLPEMLIGRNIGEYIHEADRSLALFRINERRTGDRSNHEFEIRLFIRKINNQRVIHEESDGGWPVFLVSATGLYDGPGSSGQFIGALGIARDITRRKRDLEVIRRTSEMLNNIYQSASQFAIIATDLSYRVIHNNPAAEQLFTVQPGTLTGLVITDIHATLGIEREHIINLFALALKAGKFERSLALDHGTRHLQITIMPIRDGSRIHTGYLVIGSDITERKRAEESLLHYRRAVEGSSTLMAAVNQNMEYVFANQAFLNFFDFTREKTVGFPVTQVFGEKVFQTSMAPQFERCFRGEEVMLEEIRLSPRLGERYLSITYYPLRGSNGEIRGAVTVADDISVRKDTERRIQDTLTEKEELIRELTSALDEVKTLRGFIPICAHCKKIRDDQGYWEQLEDYIGAHSEAEFSHSICPDCMKKYYPEIDSE
jgi:PAS domain S-box-containing protein